MADPLPRASQPGGSRAGGSPAPGAGAAGEPALLDLLETGELEVAGRLVDASNLTMYCTVTGPAGSVSCVYKPVAGERPLWDFPLGTLAGREVAAYAVSRAAGWNVVPPTVYREGPFGPGMCQLWIDTDDAVDLVQLSRRTDHAGLRQMAVFDAVVNNADRKIGHLLPDAGGHLYGCDHGVCFGAEYKLRTVLWQWRGKKLPGKAVAALEHLSSELLPGAALSRELDRWLEPAEIDATRARVALLAEHKVHPFPPADWPAVPWPPI